MNQLIHVNNNFKQSPISSVRTYRPSASIGPRTDEAEETSIVDVPVEDNYIFVLSNALLFHRSSVWSV